MIMKCFRLAQGAVALAIAPCALVTWAGFVTMFVLGEAGELLSKELR